MLILAGIVIITLIWYVVSLKKENKALISYSAIDQAEPWLDEYDINRDVVFASYLGRPYSLLEGTVVLVGQGKNPDGNPVGFCVEVSDRMGLLGGIIVHPVGLTTHHKQAAFYSRTTSTPIRTVIMSAMRAANSVNSAPDEDSDATDSASYTSEPVADQTVLSNSQPQDTQDPRSNEKSRLAALRRRIDAEAKRHEG